MVWLKRVSLFLITNILVITTLSIVTSLVLPLFGIDPSKSQMSSLLIFCGVWGMGGAFISLFMSKWMAKRMMGLQIIDPQTRDTQAREVVEMVYAMARKAKLPKMPEVGIYDSPEINAFATGPSKSNSLVAVSTGLLNRMSREEVEGVIGHEVAHIANGDMVTMTLIQGIVNAFVMFFARILANLISSQVDEKARGAVHFGLVILFDIAFAILASVVVNYFSRLREYRADAGGARYAGKDKMIAGLRKLQAQYDNITADDGAMATLKISNKSKGIMAWFSTHPPLTERIKRLERAAIL